MGDHSRQYSYDFKAWIRWNPDFRQAYHDHIEEGKTATEEEMSY